MTGRTGNVRSVHFPLADSKPSSSIPVNSPNGDADLDLGKNPYDCLRDTWRDTLIITEKLKHLVNSETRHGDLQIIRSAAMRIVKESSRMIEVEEK
jgi:hypothetical protein